MKKTKKEKNKPEAKQEKQYKQYKYRVPCYLCRYATVALEEIKNRSRYTHSPNTVHFLEKAYKDIEESRKKCPHCDGNGWIEGWENA